MKSNNRRRQLALEAGKAWVHTKEGGFARSKRGTFKEATVNTAFEEEGYKMKTTGPAAKAIREKLREYLQGMKTGRIQNRFNTFGSFLLFMLLNREM